MRKFILGLLTLFLISMINLSSNQLAKAQGGFGFGIGAGNWAGPGIWGGGGHYSGGGFYGMGVTVAPGHYTAPVTGENRLRSSLKQEANNPSYGFLEGYIMLCSPQTTSNQPANNDHKAVPVAIKPMEKCQPTQAGMDHVDVVASPYGLSQWIGTQPDKTGHYRLTLLPGGYLVQASDPEISNQRPIEVIVQPGQTTHQNFQLGQ